MTSEAGMRSHGRDIPKPSGKTQYFYIMSRKSKRKSLSTSNSSLNDTSGVFTSLQDLAPDSPLLVKGNLTGIPRRLKDISADWFNSRIKWRNKCASGFTICSQIGNIKNDNFIDGEHLPSSLLPLCDQLLAIANALTVIVDKMVAIRDSLHAVQDLLHSQGKADNVIFQTWTIEKYVQSVDELTAMYKNELTLKIAVQENICHTKDKHEVMYMLSTWSHEPYMKDSTLLQIDAMVTETGHEVP